MIQNTDYLVIIQQNGVSVQAPMPEAFMFDTEASFNTPLPQGFGNPLFTGVAAAFGTRLVVQSLTAQLWEGNSSAELSMELDFHTETDPVNDVRVPLLNLLKMTMPTISSTTGLLNSPGPQLDLAALGQLAKDTLQSSGQIASGIGGATMSTVKNTWDHVKNALGNNPPVQSSLNNSNNTTNDGNNTNVNSSLKKNPELGTAAYWKSQIKNQISIQIGNYLFFDSVVVTRVSQTFSSNFDAITGLPHHVRVNVGFRPLFMLVQQDLDNLFINPTNFNLPSITNPNLNIPGLNISI
jgi:hypothetical protein